jgi:magnesium chelatase subunit H
MNFIRKHSSTMKDNGLTNPAARLFSNPAGMSCVDKSDGLQATCAPEAHMPNIDSNTQNIKCQGMLCTAPGDYGSMVNEQVGSSGWENGEELGNTWQSRNAFSYGRCRHF